MRIPTLYIVTLVLVLGIGTANAFVTDEPPRPWDDPALRQESPGILGAIGGILGAIFDVPKALVEYGNYSSRSTTGVEIGLGMVPGSWIPTDQVAAFNWPGAGQVHGNGIAYSMPSYTVGGYGANLSNPNSAAYGTYRIGGTGR